MRPLLWRAIEWHLGRHLTRDQIAFVLGDLSEDYAKQAQRLGRWRADVWLVRESLVVAGAYRARAAAERRSSRRTLAGGVWRDDVRFALRRVVRQPATSAVSVLTLACAIAAGTVTWSLLSALLLSPLPVVEPERLVSVAYERPSREGQPPVRSQSFLYPTFLQIRDAEVFDGLAAGGLFTLRVAEGTGAIPQSRAVYLASHDYFATLGVPLQRGRAFTPQEDQRGAPLVAVLSDQYWRTAWNADPEVVGRTLTVLDQTATIVGVAPRGFRGLSLAEAPQLYLPFHAIGGVGPSLGHPSFNPFAEPVSTTPPYRDSPTSWIRIVGRFKAGESADHARSRLATLLPRGATVLMTPVNAAAIPETAGAGLVPFARLLTATVVLLVLIGCLTVGVLLLVRTESRRDELTLCLAMGGTRIGLARGIIFEGVILTLAGVVLALPAASVLFAGLGAFQLPGGVEIGLLDLSLDRRAWLAVAGWAFGALLLISLVAAALGFAPNVADVLRARAGGTPRTTRRRTRAALVAAQVAIALVLLVGAGLFARSLAAALALNTGFDAGRIVTGTVSLAEYGYTPERASLFVDALRERLLRNPEIEALSITQSQGGMGVRGSITVNQEPRQFSSTVSYVAVDPHYFSTLGLRAIEGRDLSRDDTANAPLVVVVSQSFGRALAAGGSPVGYRIVDTSSRMGQKPLVRDVVGVVPDVVTNVGVTEPLVIYYPGDQQSPGPSHTLVLRARRDAAPVVRAVTDAVRAMDPLVAPGPVLTMAERLGQQMNPQRLGGFVLGTLGGIAFLLTLLGAYVLAESMASGRRREMGIRAALGASRLRLGGIVLAETARLVGIGLAAGLLLAWLGANTIRSFLFRIEPLDPATLGAVALAIFALALMVSLRPALDAARVDLAETLRRE